MWRRWGHRVSHRFIWVDVDPGGGSSMGGEGGGGWSGTLPKQAGFNELGFVEPCFLLYMGGATVGSGAVPFSVVYSVAVYCLISGGWILQKMTP